MSGREFVGAGQVGDGASDLENAVVGAGGETQAADGLPEQPFDRLSDGTVAPQVARGHVGVGVQATAVAEALPLTDPGPLHSQSHGGAGFLGVRAHQVVVGHRRHLEVDVDPVQQGTGDAGAVALDVHVGTPAGVDAVAEVAAGAGVHGGGEHETCRKTETDGGTAQSYSSFHTTSIMQLIADNIRPQLFAPADFVPTTLMMSDDDKPKVSFYNCAICHDTRSALPKFAARKITGEKPLAEAVADTFVKPVTAEFFKDSPTGHALCFQCHYGFQNLPVGKNNCSGCHAPAKAFYEGKTVERDLIKFDHNRVGHGEKDCTSCHIRITQNSSVALMKDADVPITSCKSCHATQEDDPSKKILLTEIDERGRASPRRSPFSNAPIATRRRSDVSRYPQVTNSPKCDLC